MIKTIIGGLGLVCLSGLLLAHLLGFVKIAMQDLPAIILSAYVFTAVLVWPLLFPQERQPTPPEVE
ncbi:MAG: hypothetical protein Q7S04_04815 [Candidatus Moranbacteria bacterium]|nr:hypothetical protein [Candidatus Moranbacteria bacterium]